MADVFISYSQRAPEPTHALAEELIKHGIDAWFDVNLLPGEAFGKVLDGEIDRAKAVVTIWSRPALASTWVQAESQRAFDQGKLLCVRMPDVVAKELPSPFNRLHTPLVTDTEAILAGLAGKGVRRGKATLGGLQAEHGTMGEAAIAWHSVKDSSEPSEIEAFLEFYTSAAFYRLLATRKLERLKTGAAAAPAPPPVQPARPEDVSLRIEAGMHTAPIRRISLTADGRLMATGSADKTVRLWSLPDGKLVRSLRPPIGPGFEGRVSAVALAPHGKWLAAGGLNESSDHGVFIFDTATGTVVTRLGPVPNAIRDLKVPPSGDRLAAGLDANGIRVWETKGWRQVAEDRDYGGDVYCLSFAADGRLASTSFDDYIRIYGTDGRLAKKVKPPGGERPFGIAFSPDGTRLAVGYEDTTRVDVLSGQTLAHVFSADTSGIDNGDLGEVAWLADGTRLAAAGRYSAKRERPIFAWGDGGKGRRQTLPGPDNTVMALAAWGQGLAFGAASPAFGFLDPSGKRVLFRGPPMADLRGTVREHFLVSSDGRRARFGLKPLGEDPWQFDLANLKLVPSTSAPPGLQAADIDGLNVTGWRDTYEPKLGGKTLALERYEPSRSLAVAPDAQSFVLGAEWNLRQFDKDGKQLWKTPRVIQSTASLRG